VLKPLDLSESAPWKQRIRAWQIAGVSVATANEERALAFSNRTGVHQVYAWHPESGELRQLTFDEKGRRAARISPDGRWVYYLKDEKGNELGHLVRVPFEGGEAEDITPELGPYALGGVSTSRDCSRIAFLGATREGFVLRHAPVTDGRIGEWREAFRSTALTRGPGLSFDGRYASISSTERSGKDDTEVIVLDLASGEVAARLYDAGGSNESGPWKPGEHRFLGTTNVSGVLRPYLYDVATGTKTDLEVDLPGEVIATDWAPGGESVLLVNTWRARIRVFAFRLTDGTLREISRPGRTMHGATYWKDGIIALVDSPERPTTVVLLDGETGEQQKVLLQGEEVAPASPWSYVEFPSSGGVVVQGWLALPEGHDGRPSPTVIEMHGGPSAVQFEQHAPRYQALLDHGIPVFFLNYRGSVTFGREYERSIMGDLGNREVDDVVAARHWLVEQGIADPAKVFLTGWSYGGYLTLQTCGRAPGLWAGGIAGIAIADWRLMFEDQAETLRRYQASIFGGTPDEVPEATRTASPITYAQDVDAPLLVFQGENDTRCPRRQYEAYEEKMRELGKEIETVWFDAGHGSYVNEVVVEHTAKTLEFLYEKCGVRSARS